MSVGSGLRLSLIGVVVAAWSVVCGIGGGLFAVPVLHYVYRMPMRRAVATSLGLVAASTMTATISEAVHPESSLRWPVVAALVAGSLAGAQVGYRVSQRVSVRGLKALFAVLVLLVALRLYQGGTGALDGAAGATMGPWDVALVACIGFGSGFVSPLLGIGGGLVAVPSLYFGLPELGYLGARACSIAMAVVNSSRSLWLYAAAGRIEVECAIWFGLGGAAGAVAGVQLVHLPEVAPVARSMMALTLVLLSSRFAWDVLSGRRDDRED
ncbi:MAG: sulfite exporter TauE/SafE family protein [Planctomycetota bacterium]|nr:sulfite exporter TauE/SafE family protein [Planctomycetota bacterium]MDP6761357.1 sulfite exporter TauE/SafE family protein [Planctomycetota bacterium]MDP6989936.1 sulfite exporter TauE/SafE family protein [Planctomycetota bacterium]